MGVNLKVMASHFPERGGEILPTATLQFERDFALFRQLAPDAAPSLVFPLPDGLSVGSHKAKGSQYTTLDRYGNRLTFTTPTDLAGLVLPNHFVPWNRAILAFLFALPSETRIVLFWC